MLGVRHGWSWGSVGPRLIGGRGTAKRKPRAVKPPEISPEAALSPEELQLVEEAGQLVYGVDAAIRTAGLLIRGLTVAGGEGIIVLNGVARTAIVKRRAGEVAAGVPPSPLSRSRCTRAETSARCRFSRTHCKKRAVTVPPSSTIVAVRTKCMSAGAGWSIEY